MSTIRINGQQITMNHEGLYRLDDVYKASHTEAFKETCTLGKLRSVKPISYLESQSSKRLSAALLEDNKLAYSVEVRPNGSCFVCRELLIDYARNHSPELLISVLGQLIDFRDPYIKETDFMVDFWDSFERLNSRGYGLDHSLNKSIIAINVTQVFREIVLPKRPYMNRDAFITGMRSSCRYRYLKDQSMKSKVWGKNVWCMLFDRA